jgi:hypothetical protein
MEKKWGKSSFYEEKSLVGLTPEMLDNKKIFFGFFLFKATFTTMASYREVNFMQE